MRRRSVAERAVVCQCAASCRARSARRRDSGSCATIRAMTVSTGRRDRHGAHRGGSPRPRRPCSWLSRACSPTVSPSPTPGDADREPPRPRARRASGAPSPTAAATPAASASSAAVADCGPERPHDDRRSVGRRRGQPWRGCHGHRGRDGLPAAGDAGRRDGRFDRQGPRPQRPADQRRRAGPRARGEPHLLVPREQLVRLRPRGCRSRRSALVADGAIEIGGLVMTADRSAAVQRPGPARRSSRRTTGSRVRGRKARVGLVRRRDGPGLTASATLRGRHPRCPVGCRRPPLPSVRVAPARRAAGARDARRGPLDGRDVVRRARRASSGRRPQPKTTACSGVNVRTTPQHDARRSRRRSAAA